MENQKIKNPEVLYRYRSLGNSWANTLSEILGQMYFARAEILNDPFDGLTYAPKYNRILNHPKFIEPLHLIEIWSVVCFSTKWDNPTMWSHYADNYKGICLGYDRLVLQKKMDTMRPENNAVVTNSFLKPMRYKKDLFLNNENTEDLLTVKTEHWSYEDEWRFGILGRYGNISIREKGFEYPIRKAIKEILYTSEIKRNELNIIKMIIKTLDYPIDLYKVEIDKKNMIMTREKQNTQIFYTH